MSTTITGTGPTVLRTFTFPDQSATVLTSAAAVTPAQGGTGIAAYTIGDLLYASGAAALSVLADVAAGSVLVSGGVATAPAWSASPTLTKVLVGGGTPAAPSVAFASETGTGVFLEDSGYVTFSSNGTRSGAIGVAGWLMSSSVPFGWTSGAIHSTAVDTQLQRGGGAGKVSVIGTTPMLQLGGTTSSFPALKRDTIFAQLRLADDSAVSGAVTASLPAAAAGRDGIIGFDTTLNALVYYVGGARFKVVGTSF